MERLRCLFVTFRYSCLVWRYLLCLTIRMDQVFVDEKPRMKIRGKRCSHLLWKRFGGLQRFSLSKAIRPTMYRAKKKVTPYVFVKNRHGRRTCGLSCKKIVNILLCDLSAKSFPSYKRILSFPTTFASKFDYKFFGDSSGNFIKST